MGSGMARESWPSVGMSTFRALLWLLPGMALTCQASEAWWQSTVLQQGSPGLSGALGQPFGVAVGPDGALYVTEVTHHRILRLDLDTGQTRVIAGTGQAGYSGDGGPATQATMNEPYEVRFDAEGNLYVVEIRNHVVRRIRRRDGVIETVAGTGEPGFGGDGGPARQAQLQRPHSIEIAGSKLWIADIGNHRIREVDLESGKIVTIAGNGEAELPQDGQPARGRPVAGPRALGWDGRVLWVALREGHSIWQLDVERDRWRHVAGTGQRGYAGDGGPAAAAQFAGPKGIALGPDGSVWIADTENSAIRRIDAKTRRIETVTATQPERPSSWARPHGITVDQAGRVFVADTENARVAMVVRPLRVGIIGLDTSHVIAFTKILNGPRPAPALQGTRVVAAYPPGSPDIESSVRRRAGYVKTLREEWQVEMVESIDALLERVDVVLLESNDGRPHLEQALPVLRKRVPLFIDKPIAGSLADAVAIFQAARHWRTPVFSSSSLRFARSTQDVRHGRIGRVRMAMTYSPCSLEKTHPDLYWYGIHGVESLFTVMGSGCQKVRRVQTPSLELVTGVWQGGRIGTFHGLRPPAKGGYGGTAVGEKGILPVGSYDGYQPLLVEIVEFFRTGKPPVSPEETLEIYAFMTAADVSKAEAGRFVTLEEVLTSAKQTAARTLRAHGIPASK